MPLLVTHGEKEFKMIIITGQGDKVHIEFDPYVDSRIKQTKRKTSVVDVVLEEFDGDSIVFLYYQDGNKTDLHWMVHYPEYMADNSIEWGIKIDGVKATSNEDLFNKLEAIF